MGGKQKIDYSWYGLTGKGLIMLKEPKPANEAAMTDDVC